MATLNGGGMKIPSERTFGQRYAKGVAVYDLVKGEADYDPQGNPLIMKVAFRAFLDGVRDANQLVSEFAPAYDGAQDARLAMYHGPEGIVQRAVLVRDVIGGLKGGKQSTAYKTVRKIVQEMRAYRKPKKEAADGTEPVTRSTAQTSFGSLLLKGGEVLGVIKELGVGYVTANPLVTVAALEQYLGDVEAQDTVVADVRTPLNKAVKARKELFEGVEGLPQRIAAVKSYVAGEMAGGKKSGLHRELVKVRYQ